MVENKRTFEQSMAELEGVVKKLEAGSVSLDESITSFETGMKLATECETYLTEAKGKVEKLVKDAAGGMKTENFEPKE